MKVEKKKAVIKKKVEEISLYFTDEMHKGIFPFQDRPGKTKKPITSTIKFTFSK